MLDCHRCHDHRGHHGLHGRHGHHDDHCGHRGLHCGHHQAWTLLHPIHIVRHRCQHIQDLHHKFLRNHQQSILPHCLHSNIHR